MVDGLEDLLPDFGGGSESHTVLLAHHESDRQVPAS